MTDYIATDTELTSVANAIRTKGGTNAQLSFPTEFVSAINAISTGSVPENSVTFIDYDGTILYSYTRSEFANLSSMPPNPDRTSKGLVAQGWNWSLADAKDQMTITNGLVIGQMYTTVDGKTHFKISFSEDSVSTTRTVTLYLTQSDANVATIDWGDGSAVETDSTSGANTFSKQHVYNEGGDYDITVSVAAGGSVRFGYAGDNSSSNMFGLTTALTTLRNYAIVKEINIGNGINGLGNYSFANFEQLDRISIPNTTTNFDYSGSLTRCYSLQGLVIPSGATVIGGYFTNGCYGLKYVSIPKGVTTIKTYALSYHYNMARIELPSTVNTCGSYSLAYSYKLKNIYIPDLTQIGASTFTHCHGIETVTIPNTVTGIYGYAFQYCYRLKSIHMESTAPPGLSGSSWFDNNDGLVIYVPRSTNQTVLNAYKTATNWSNYSSRMQEEPE